MINAYKGAVTLETRRVPGYEEIHIWQGRYHDHIIRSEPDYQRIVTYIEANPQRWTADSLYS